MKLFKGLWSPLDTSGPQKATVIVVDPKPDTSGWIKITEVKDLPDTELIFKYATWGQLIHFLKILYVKNLEMAKQNAEKDVRS